MNGHNTDKEPPMTTTTETLTPAWELDNLCSDRQLVAIPTAPEFQTGSKQIGPYDLTPRVGSWISLTDGPSPTSGDWHGKHLHPCDWWDGADFAVEVPPPVGRVAVRIAITGRTLQYFDGEAWVRVRVTFPGDDEPDSHCKGWMGVPILRLAKAE
jgi:hypothetical protein